MLKPYGEMFIIENITAKLNKSKIPRNKSQRIDQIQAAINYGIDISMLIQNISRGYTKRIIRHQIALNTVEKLRKAKRL